MVLDQQVPWHLASPKALWNAHRFKLLGREPTKWEGEARERDKPHSREKGLQVVLKEVGNHH